MKKDIKKKIFFKNHENQTQKNQLYKPVRHDLNKIVCGSSYTYTQTKYIHTYAHAYM